MKISDVQIYPVKSPTPGHGGAGFLLKRDELVSNTYPLSGINRALETAERGEALRHVIVFD